MRRFFLIASAICAVIYLKAGAQGFVSLDYRAYSYLPGGQSYNQTYLRAGTDQTSGDLRTRSYFEFNDNALKSPALNRVELQFSGWKLFNGRWDASLGDVSLVPLSSGQVSVPIRGTRLIGSWGRRMTTETHAGRSSDRINRSNFPTFRNNDLILSQGMKLLLSKTLTVRSRLAFRSDKEAEPYHTSLQARELLDWGSRLEWVIAPGIKNQHHLNISRNSGFNGVRRTDLSVGSLWEYRDRTFQGSADYQYQGPNYISPANDGSGHRENQLALNSSYVLRHKITLMSDYSQKWADHPVDSTIQWARFQRFGAGFRTNIPRWPAFSYKLSRYLWGYQRSTGLLYSTMQWNNNIELHYLWGLIMWRLAYQLQDQQNRLTRSHRLWHQWSLSGGQRFGQYSLNLNERLSRYNNPNQAQWSQGFSFGQRWGRLLNTELNLDWGQGNTMSERWKTENLGWSIKAGTDRGQGWNLSLDLSQNLHFYSDLGPMGRNTNWGFRLERSFKNLGELVSLGQVNGLVYEDANGNLVFDQGDKGIADIPMLIDGKKAGRTDKNGKYQILGIGAGSHNVKLDVSQLSASMDPSVGGQRRFTTVGLWGPRVDFPLAPLNEIYGKVFQDDNRNGVFDEDESGLPGVFVLMGDDRRFTSSDDEGNYVFHNVQPGRYRVFIDPRFLPDTLSVTGKEQIWVEVENQNDVGGIAFGIGKKTRPVRKVVFAPSQVESPGPAPQKTPRTGGPRPVKPKAAASPADVKRLYDSAVRQYASGDYQLALETWQQLLRIDPGNVDAKKNLERTKAKLEALKKARGQ